MHGGTLGGKGGGDLTHGQPEVLLYSHSGGELWGSCSHPFLPDLYVTVGDDCTLRVWSVSTNRMVHSLGLGWPARWVHVLYLLQFYILWFYYFILHFLTSF